MVEEFMLLANISVAQKIYEEFPECALLRKHPAPPPSNYDILVKAAKSKVCAKFPYLYLFCIQVAYSCLLYNIIEFFVLIGQKVIRCL